MKKFGDDASRLILGGHSFIQQLGSDPPTDEQLQVEIVRACLDAGITTFDTTYQPERIALARALSTLNRRDEATIIAWNFFTPFGPGDEVGGPAPYEPEHWDMLCRQLRTDHIEMLVVHGVGKPAEDAAQLHLAMRWQTEGKVDRLGIWAPPADVQTQWPDGGPYALAVMRCNVVEPNTERFASAKVVGWETLAVCPFGRGWELDKQAERFATLEGVDIETARSRVAEAMLRYSAFAPGVDRLIVAMRRVEWVEANLRYLRKGPLSTEQTAWLESLADSG
ncbi:MAG TPA: aldo/keto reductase [Phycisphaerae bacterium]|nr:aldo/keto reductase [Phycisphaerae bacterium]